ncbi:potassium/proton antiporter [Dactylosporangium vinaceum]|uniref:Potassium/proton antiporter n=1 Tax=Dactylosporangium vinaceum TaxID=53362 RepID=A0ABV5MGS5_9ACTN|nr:potassium/proton antiporter [Dactylosporangium vinaceum]UAB94983.1 potassium/proton antiporter [Dactylosporangium vinaceum]
MSHELNVALLVGAAVLLVCVGAVRLSVRLGLPSLLVYLLLGLVIGEAGLGIQFTDAELTRTLGICALVVIIAEGGLTARWSTLRPVLGPAVVLSTLGVVVSVGVVGAVLHYVLGVGWQQALLTGAVLSSTDAAAVFSTLRRVPVRPRLAALLEAESGINDAPVVILVVLLSAPLTGQHPWYQQLGLVAYELVTGAAVGLVIGFGGAWALRRAALPSAGLYPLAAIGLTVLAYAAGSVAHASGFLAVYVTGVILGNARLPHRRAMLGFADGLAWLAQIGLFVLLGLLASPKALGGAVITALVVGLVLVLVARPLSVLVSSAPFLLTESGPGWRDQAFLSWAGLRGAVPVVLATIPLSAGLPGAQDLFNVVFVLVVIYTAVQGMSLPPVARRLGVTAPAEPTDLQVEAAPLERMGADLLQVEVPDGSKLNGVHVDELRLPLGAVVTLVLRDGGAFVPVPETRLKTRDSLLIVTTEQVRDAAEQRLRAVSRRGRLARWFAEHGDDRRQ